MARKAASPVIQMTRKPTTKARDAKARANKPRTSSPSYVLPTAPAVGTGQRRAQQQARRRRQTAKQVRRFESLLANVHLPSMQGVSLHLPLALRKWHASKVVSLLLLTLAVALITWVHTDDRWFVYREMVTFQNLTYLDAEQLYDVIEVEGWNTFWLSPSAIRDRLVALPTVADAQVQIRLPHRVLITVTEEAPIAQWITQQGNFWLLADGTALTALDERYANLPRIVDPQRDARSFAPSTELQMNLEVLRSAQALLNLMPDVGNLTYNQGLGLNFHMPGSSTWVYWGDGQRMETKYNNLLAIQNLLLKESRAASIIDVRFEKTLVK